MSVNGVEGRLAEINKMKKVEENKKRRSSTVASFSNSVGITSTASTVCQSPTRNLMPLFKNCLQNQKVQFPVALHHQARLLKINPNPS